MAETFKYSMKSFTHQQGIFLANVDFLYIILELGYFRKNPNRGGWENSFLKKALEFLGLSLCL